MLLFYLSLSQAEGKGEEGEERMRGEDGEAGTGGGSTPLLVGKGGGGSGRKRVRDSAVPISVKKGEAVCLEEGGRGKDEGTDGGRTRGSRERRDLTSAIAVLLFRGLLGESEVL